MERVWSQYQNTIFDFVENGTGNAVIEAVAGSGKSSTIEECVKRSKSVFPAKPRSSIFLAFNKPIAEELKKRGLNARTFHSICWGAVMNSGSYTLNSDKLSNLADRFMTGDEIGMYKSFCIKLVDLAKQAGIGCLVDDTISTWNRIVDYYDLEPDNESASVNQGIDLARTLLDMNNKSREVDFSDMLYFAVKNGISLPKFDHIFVDEAQDTNAIQRAILRKMMKPSSRLFAVGDPAQAIYGFRGADSSALDLIVDDFNCIRLPLSVTYRCPTNVVTYAQQWVNHIQAAPGAGEGEVKELGLDWKLEDMLPGDLIVCRRTLPLMGLVYRCLRERKPVTMMGNDLAKGLVSTIQKMKAKGIDQLEQKLEVFRERETEKAIAKNKTSKAQAIEDHVAAIGCLISSLTENNRTVPALIATIHELFRDKSGAIILSSIHRAKGLEAMRVWWLDRSSCPAPWAKLPWEKQQELNLCYVAATRTKHSLFCIEVE